MGQVLLLPGACNDSFSRTEHQFQLVNGLRLELLCSMYLLPDGTATISILSYKICLNKSRMGRLIRHKKIKSFNIIYLRFSI